LKSRKYSYPNNFAGNTEWNVGTVSETSTLQLTPSVLEPYT